MMCGRRRLVHVHRGYGEDLMQHSESIVVERPAQDVWELTGDLRAWSAWSPNIEVIEVVPEGTLAKGSKVRYRYRGRETNATVAQYEEQRVVGIEAPGKSYDFRESITLMPQGQNTEVTFFMAFEPKVWFMSALAVLLIPVKSWVLGRPLKRELRDIKAAVEARTPRV
jgi:carbon monoxide dehydrogenase subunit G